MLNVDSSDLEGYKNLEDYMSVAYVEQYASSVIFSDYGFANLESGPFAGTQFEMRGDRRVLESVGEGFQFISAEDQGDGSFDINYRISAIFILKINKISEEEAVLICQNELASVVQLIEGSTNEPYKFVEISVEHIYPDK